MLVRKDINTHLKTTLSSAIQWEQKFWKTVYRLNIMNWQVIGISPIAVIVSGCQKIGRNQINTNKNTNLSCLFMDIQGTVAILILGLAAMLVNVL
jgi:hypothetical protein